MKSSSVKELIVIALFAAVISVSSYLSIPLGFSPVPITLQSLAIILVALLLNVKLATSSVALWALMGAIGLPVFANGSAGLAVILGPTGGYILGYIACTIFIAIFRGDGLSIIKNSIVAAIGSFVIIYSFGVIGLMRVTGMSLSQAFTAGVLPFLIGDSIKLLVASLIAAQIHRSAGPMIKQYNN